MLESYKKLVAFLGQILGGHCKIVLFDLTVTPPSVVAIANGTMEGGKGIGAPLTKVAREIIESEEWKVCDYKSEFLGRTRNGELLKSSYFFIKDGSKLIGMLSINSSASQYQKLCQDILQMGGFSSLLTLQPAASATVSEHFSESFSDVSEVVSTVMGAHFSGISAERLNQSEKMTVIQELHDKGVFLIKGAVPEVAQALSCSEATVYRYLSKLSRKPK